jgi:ADP-heptose:LPS heptosyltransferase
MNRTDTTDKTDKEFYKNKDKKGSILEFFVNYKFLEKILIVFLDGFFSAIRVFFSSTKKTNNIVIINLNRLGDTVFTIPAINVILKEYHQSYKIFILSYPDSKGILELKYDASMIKSINKTNFFLNRRIADKTARNALSNLKPEMIFDLTGNILSASLIYSSRAAKIYGTNQKYYKNIYNKFTPLRTIPHLIDLYLDVPQLCIKFQRNNLLYENKIKINRKGEILIHPFALRAAKEWNLSKYIKLAESLSKDFKVKLIIPSDYVESYTFQECEKLNIPVITTPDISILIKSIRGSALYISNDTGPLYIANLLGVPTFTIYGPTNPDFSFPFGNFHRYIRKLISCSPTEGQYCFTQGGIYCPDYVCMNSLTVEEVLAQVNNFISYLDIDRNKVNA